jgi:hypothetical protein
MNLRRSWLISSYLLIGIGLISIPIADGSWFLCGLASLGLLLSYLFNIRRQRAFCPRPLGNILTLLAILFFGVERIYYFEPFLSCFLHLLINLQLIRLFHRKADREYRLLYLSAFVQMVAASFLTTSVTFLLTFLSFLYVGIWTFILSHFTMQSGLTGANSVEGEKRLAPDPVPWRISGAIRLVHLNRLVFGAFLMMLLINGFFFLLMPRINSLQLGFSLDSSQSITGFSESVEIGELGLIKENETPVMRVFMSPLGQLPDQASWDRFFQRIRGAEWIRFRGIAFDSFDGRKWHLTLPGEVRLGQTFGSPIDLRKHIARRRIAPKDRLMVKQKYIIEGLNTRVIFGLYQPAGLPLMPREATIDPLEGLRLRQPYPGGISYEMISALAMNRRALRDYSLSSGDLGEPALSPYRQLPLLNPDVCELARDVVTGQTADFDRAVALEQYLKKNYQYSLVAVPTYGVDPIQDFLFVRRQGHCEYFASALTVLLRCVDIPARLVNGFLPGEWNSVGEPYFLVRQKDAHTWVEAYLGQAGWVTFDATPGDNRQNFRQKQGMSHTISLYLDYLRIKWYALVIDYNQKKQNQLYLKAINLIRQRLAALQTSLSAWNTQLQATLRAGWQRFRANPKPLLRPGWPGLLFLGGSGGGLLILIFFRWRRQHRAITLPREVRFFADFLRCLKKQGWEKERSETSLEFIQRLMLQYPRTFRQGEFLVEAYYRVRYGHQPLASADREKIAEILRTIRKHKKSSRGDEGV